MKSSHHLFFRSMKGFTLVELMVVVVIVGILASIAYPSYVESVRRGRRAEARAALLELLQQQERFMTQNNTYRTFAAGARDVPFITFSGERGSPTYNLSAEQCRADIGVNACIRLVATPVQKDPRAGQLRLSSTGIRDCVGGSDSVSNPRICWP